MVEKKIEKIPMEIPEFNGYETAQEWEIQLSRLILIYPIDKVNGNEWKRFAMVMENTFKIIQNLVDERLSEK